MKNAGLSGASRHRVRGSRGHRGQGHQGNRGRGDRGSQDQDGQDPTQGLQGGQGPIQDQDDQGIEAASDGNARTQGGKAELGRIETTSDRYGLRPKCLRKE